ncbi:MAG TPA: DEAD/DEAH box helicase [Phycisphaerae bacterium]|nr:DEAD/DEAH box helicase [Phycisphaerae bacterium]
MNLRPYQSAAVDAIFEAWETAPACLAVMPTGTGKTVVFASVIARLLADRPGLRAMVLAHREELIFQAAEKIGRVAGHQADIEMAEMRAGRGFFGQARVVVSSIQTQNAGRDAARMERFDPAEFGLLIIDEAHHATAASYRRVLDHYRQNPALRVLGATATPDRHDEEALGRVFDTVAFDYELTDAIADGWLVPIRQRMVAVDGLDLSACRTTAGDLNGADLARVMEYEEALHGIAAPTLDLTAGRRTLLFAASVAHAERLCEIFNRHTAGIARWVHGGTPKEARRDMLVAYKAGEFGILCNVGVATEGFDEPGIECVVMARPTKSRALYAQMIGRGTRPLEALAAGLNDLDPAGRRAAIDASGKPALEVIDFSGNAGRHKLVSTADILGGNYSDEAIGRARTRAATAAGAPVDVAAALFDAEAEIRGEKLAAEAAAEAEKEAAAEAERQRRQALRPAAKYTAEKEAAAEAERQRRQALRPAAKYTTRTVDPFDVFGLEPHRERGWDKGRVPSEKMIAMLERQGIDARRLTFTAAKQLIGEITSRWDADRCTFKQAKVLARFGYPADVSFAEARRLIDGLAANNWKRPAGDAAAPVTDHTPAPVEVY